MVKIVFYYIFLRQNENKGIKAKKSNRTWVMFYKILLDATYRHYRLQ